MASRWRCSTFRLFQRCSNILGITGKRIIATGDSAGGYLAAAVTLEAIMNKIKVPWKLMLVYPVMYRDMSSDLESHVLYQNDLVIPRRFDLG